MHLLSCSLNNLGNNNLGTNNLEYMCLMAENDEALWLWRHFLIPSLTAIKPPYKKRLWKVSIFSCRGSGVLNKYLLDG